MCWVIKNWFFVNIFSDYGWIYQTTFKTIRSDIKSRLFPKKVKIVPPYSRRFWVFAFWMIFSVFQKNRVLGYSWSTLQWHRCYLHRSRDALSPVCGIFFLGGYFCWALAWLGSFWVENTVVTLCPIIGWLLNVFLCHPASSALVSNVVLKFRRPSSRARQDIFTWPGP